MKEYIIRKIKCPSCDGEGWVINADGSSAAQKVCPACKGNKTIIERIMRSEPSRTTRLSREK